MISRGDACVARFALTQVPPPTRPITDLMDPSIYRMRLRDILSACVLVLLSLGVVMVQSASTSLSGSITHAAARNPDATHPPGPEAVADFTAAIGSEGTELSWTIDTSPTVTAYR